MSQLHHKSLEEKISLNYFRVGETYQNHVITHVSCIFGSACLSFVTVHDYCSFHYRSLTISKLQCIPNYPYTVCTLCPEFSYELLLTVQLSVSWSVALCLSTSLTQSFYYRTVLTCSLTQFCFMHSSVHPCLKLIHQHKSNIFRTVTLYRVLIGKEKCYPTFCPDAPVSTNVEKMGRGWCEFSGQHSMIAP